ncbi:MAG: GGDEF domain-containing protein [Solirubrobacteraceae bacterium]
MMLHLTATIEPAWLAITICVLAVLVVVVLLWRLFASRTRLEAMNAELERVARIDSLTGMYNRRHVEEQLEGLVSAAKRHGTALSVLMIDVDGFKAINDTHGRRGGDLALRQVGTAIRSALRMEDSLGRWGGEEFLAVLPTTDAAGALVVAHRLRKRVATSSARLANGTGVSLTVTVGGASWAEGDDVNDLLKRADGALDLGKAGGRNTAVVPEASAGAALS